MRERLLNHLQTKNYNGFRSYNQYLHAECQNNILKRQVCHGRSLQNFCMASKF